MAIKVTRDSSGRKPTFNEINITPLTDIFLVLLIIMMVIAPSFQSVDNNIDIPEISSGTGIEDMNVVVSITSSGEIFLNDEKVVKDDIEQKLEELHDTLGSADVTVKADKLTKSSEILDIMHFAQNAGYKKLIVAGEPLSETEQKELLEDEE